MGYEIVEATSATLWLSALAFLMLDLFFYWIINRQIDRTRFRKLRWYLVLGAALFWGAFAIFLLQAFWESYYAHFYPSWFRGVGILVSAPVIYGFCALAFHWLSQRIPGNPILIFLLLGAVESILEHLWGIIRLRILEVPMFEDAATLDILAVAVPEYIFYWCLVILIASILQKFLDWIRKTRG